MRASQRFSGRKIAEILVEKHAGHGLQAGYLQMWEGLRERGYLTAELIQLSQFICGVVAESSPEHCVELTCCPDWVR